MKRFIKTERGSALVIVLVATASLLILGGALMNYSLNERFIATHQERNVNLYYIAEAGIEEGVAVKRRSFHHSQGFEGEIGKGRYEVSFEFISMDKWKIISTGYLGDENLTLAVIVELRDLYEKAMMVSDDLTIEEVRIRGNLHANEMFQIKKSNNEVLHTLDADGNPNDDGYLTYSDITQHKIDFIAGGALVVDGVTYNSNNKFPAEWYDDPIPLPKIDYNAFVAQHDFCDLTGGVTWSALPSCYTDHGREHLRVDGNLTIQAAKNTTIDFDGVLYVKGNLNLHGEGHGNAGNLNVGGVIVVTGDVQVKGKVNEGVTDNVTIIVSERKVYFYGDDLYDENAPFFGGVLLIFGGEEVQLGGPNLKARFHMFGTIISKKINLRMCNLTYIPDVATDVSQHFPGYGVVITEWIRP